MSTNTTHYNLKKPAASENYSVTDQNNNMDKIDTALFVQSNRETMMKISCTSLQDMKDKLTSLFSDVAVETSIELVLVTTAFDIFPAGTHSFTFHKLAGNYWWGYGFVSNKLAIISNSNGTWKTLKYGDVLSNSISSDQRIFLERNGSIYHLHYERYSTVANGTQVTTLNSDYAPSTAAIGKCWFMQSSGYAVVRCTVATDGKVTLSADTYNQNLAGVFDVYWEK